MGVGTLWMDGDLMIILWHFKEGKGVGIGCLYTQDH